MREIKFRAWDKAKGEWIDQGFHLMGETMLGGLLFERKLEEWEDVLIEQFTGLKDKNGREIYEGDILKNGDTFPCVIEWDGNHCRFSLFQVGRLRDIGSGFGVQNAGRYYEVIGNIHENKDLI